MKSLPDIFKEYINGISNTHVYGLFIVYFLILHIDLIYFALFIDQNLVLSHYGVLKSEYIASHYNINICTWSFWWIESIKVILAMGLSYLMIWKFPGWVTEPAYKKELEDKYILESKKIEIDSRLENEKKDLANKRLEVAKIINTVQEEQERIVKSEEQVWDEDYRTFARSAMFNLSNDIIKSAYEYNGRIDATNATGRKIWSIDTNILAYANSNELIGLDQMSESIELTMKGKYFVKRYQLNKYDHQVTENIKINIPKRT